ncbi:hypothetical protein TNCT_77881, partial [Trichonephila clavata]
YTSKNHNDARNSGKRQSGILIRGKGSNVTNVGLQPLRPQCPNLKTHKADLCRIGGSQKESLRSLYFRGKS